MYLLNVMEEIFQERRSFLKSKKKERREWDKWDHVEVPQEAFMSVLKVD